MDKAVLALALALIAGLYVASRLALPEQVDISADTESRTSFCAAIQMAAYRDTSKALGIGYNYMLLKEFAKDYNLSDTIELCPRGESRIDSLLTGAIDILVLPFNDSLQTEGILISNPIDSISMWVVRSDDTILLNDIDSWLEQSEASGRFLSVKNKYLKHLSPYKAGRRGWISPYDSLIKVNAAKIGWDWHTLAAVIYTESRFHIEAISPRGATGLMQLMPKMAAKLGFEEIVDPEESIAAGTELLGRLTARYRDIAADKVETEKFALAAYNAGIGHIQDCITYARSKGIEPRFWDDLLLIMPEMRDSTILENEAIRLGTFNGSETTLFVSSVTDISEVFKNICP